MPGRKTALEVFRRDGWRCRFCGIRILSLDAIKLLDAIFPDEVRWRVKPYRNRNAAFNVLASSLDHILPHGRGGDNDMVNLVAACGSCQFGRMQYTLEEVGFIDPRARPPIVDAWDGLERLLRVGSA
jgi:5-methylcytosine-specific restriction endonuclease McrA